MMSNEFGIESSNINVKWIENIYENIKKIEEYERLAREGCSSILEYVQYPITNRNLLLAEIQYKNIRLLLNEFILVIPDIVPVIGEESSKSFLDTLDRISNIINNKESLVEQVRSDVNNNIRDAKMTPMFFKTLKVLSDCRIELIKMLKHILYVQEARKNGRR